MAFRVPVPLKLTYRATDTLQRPRVSRLRDRPTDRPLEHAIGRPRDNVVANEGRLRRGQVERRTAPGPRPSEPCRAARPTRSAGAPVWPVRCTVQLAGGRPRADSHKFPAGRRRDTNCLCVRLPARRWFASVKGYSQAPAWREEEG